MKGYFNYIVKEIKYMLPNDIEEGLLMMMYVGIFAVLMVISIAFLQE